MKLTNPYQPNILIAYFLLNVVVCASMLLFILFPSKTTIIYLQTPQNLILEAKDYSSATFYAYSPTERQTDSNPMLTATSVAPYIGAVACPRSLPFYTQIEIKGFGVYTCVDRMSLKHPEDFDIFFFSEQEALKFGKQTLKYRVLEDKLGI